MSKSALRIAAGCSNLTKETPRGGLGAATRASGAVKARDGQAPRKPPQDPEGFSHTKYVDKDGFDQSAIVAGRTGHTNSRHPRIGCFCPRNEPLASTPLFYSFSNGAVT